jgi:hypothetical protein
MKGPRDVGLGGDQLQIGGHRMLGVEQALVHVDVNDLGAVLHLLAGDFDRGGIVAGHDQLLEAGRAGNIGALADIDERSDLLGHTTLVLGAWEALGVRRRAPWVRGRPAG